MSAESPDGRPPTHRLRGREWRWLAIGVSTLLVSAIVWAVVGGVHWATVLAACALILILFAAGSPVWGAALLRGGEERRALREARVELGIKVIRGTANPPADTEKPVRIPAAGTPPVAAPSPTGVSVP